MSERFENTGETLRTFADEFLILCPRCGQQARVTRVERAREIRPSGAIAVHARAVCLHCAYAQEKAFDGYGYGTATDMYFHYPLWLQVPCCGQVLWAYNYRHLSYLERYVEANLRDECSSPNTGLARYLPKWMKIAKNRDEVLKGIDKLRTS